MSVSVEHKEAPFQSQTQHKLEDIMVVQDLKMHFPVTAGLLKRQVGGGQGGGRGIFFHQTRTDSWYRGRVWFR